MTFSKEFVAESVAILEAIDTEPIEELAVGIAAIRDRGGRLFILGVGGSAGHASHAVNDFRKICDIETYTPTDNVSELTARANDEGWDTTFSEWLKGSRLSAADGLLVFSVGGGDEVKGVSKNIVAALQAGRGAGTPIFGIVGRDGGTTAKLAQACVVIPPLFPDHITPQTEGMCALIWHLLVTHPALARVGHPLGVPDVSASAPARTCIVGGAGFIGGHFAAELLSREQTEQVTVYDNFSSGRRWHLEAIQRRSPAAGGRGRRRRPGRAVPRPRRGTTRSSIWPPTRTSRRPPPTGDRLRPGHPADPPCGRGGPPRAASDSCCTPPAAGSTAISARPWPTRTTVHWCRCRPTAPASWRVRRCSASYAYMFGITARCFRFGNVVGPRQTHGVGYDFVRRLIADPSTPADPRRRPAEQVLRPRRGRHGCGAHRRASRRPRPFAVFNVATEDYITVTEIAELAVEVLGLARRRAPGSTTPAVTAAGRAMCRSCGSTPTASARWAGRTSDRYGRRCRRRWPRWPLTSGRGGSTFDVRPSGQAALGRRSSSTGTAC